MDFDQTCVDSSCCMFKGSGSAVIYSLSIFSPIVRGDLVLRSLPIGITITLNQQGRQCLVAFDYDKV